MPKLRSARVRSARVCALLAAMSYACGATQIRESHVLQAVQGDGEIAYYRLSIEGDADLAKTNYRAGLYDAEGLDVLLSGESLADESSVDRTVARLRSEAVQETGALYYETLKTGSEEDIARDQKRFATAMKSPWLLASESLGGEGAAPKRKYAIIYSAMASVVEEAIAGFAEEKETQDMVLAAVASMQRDEYLAVNAEQESLGRTVAMLTRLQTEAAALKLDAGATAEAKKEFVDSLTRMLQDVASIRVR